MNSILGKVYPFHYELDRHYDTSEIVEWCLEIGIDDFDITHTHKAQTRRTVLRFASEDSLAFAVLKFG